MKKILMCICVLSSLVGAPTVVVLGSGIAGMTSAIYLARAGYAPIVIEGKHPGGAITQSNCVQNFPGFFSISGIDLAENIRKQAEQNGVIFRSQELVQVDFSTKPFTFILRDIINPGQVEKIKADGCIVALGSSPRKLQVPGEDQYWGKGVYSCAVCDGSFYKDKVVAVVGGGDAALLEAEYLSGIAKKVYVVNRKESFRGTERNREAQIKSMNHVEILYDSKVEEISGSDHVESLVVRSKEGKRVIPVDALFLAIGSTPNTNLFSKQLELDPQGYIVRKEGCKTSVPGVCVAGDVADPFLKQAVIAGGDGAQAAMQLQEHLKQVPLVVEVHTIEELKQVVASHSGLVLLDFHATWCAPCRQLSRFIPAWAKELSGKAIICTVNVDHSEELVRKYQVSAMPTLVVLEKGNEVARKLGPEEIANYMQSLKR